MSDFTIHVFKILLLTGVWFLAGFNIGARAGARKMARSIHDKLDKAINNLKP